MAGLELLAFAKRSSISPARTASIRVLITVGSLSFDGTAIPALPFSNSMGLAPNLTDMMIWPVGSIFHHGQIIMSVKFGAKPIEFEKGKAGIAVPSKDKLPTVINTLIEAVRAGEMDDLFANASNSRPAIGKK